MLDRYTNDRVVRLNTTGWSSHSSSERLYQLPIMQTTKPAIDMRVRNMKVLKLIM